MTNYIIVDFNNLTHRVKYALGGDADTKGGMAIHICFNSLKKLWNMFKGDHIVIALDGGKSWREQTFAEYKAQRKVKKNLRTPKEVEDDEIFFQYVEEAIEYFVKKTNMTVLQVPFCEADDIIARWTQLHPEDNHIIFSSDTDFYQLLAPNVKIYNGTKEQIITLDGFFEDDWTPVKTETSRKATKDESDDFLNEMEKTYTVKEIKKGLLTEYKVLDGKTMVAMVTKKESDKTSRETYKIITVDDKAGPEPKWELFKKIMVGDSSDNIFRACKPRLQEKKIREAWEDRNKKGFAWNNIMLDTWTDHNGVDQDVQTRFAENEILVDLSKQPANILQSLDKAIVEAVQEPKKTNVGIGFIQFCSEFRLDRIDKDSKNYLTFLNSSY